jgi:hypothetical protein
MPDRRTREVRLIPVITGADWTRSRLAFARHLALAYFAPRVFRTGFEQPHAQVPTYTPRPAPRFTDAPLRRPYPHRPVRRIPPATGCPSGCG